MKTPCGGRFCAIYKRFTIAAFMSLSLERILEESVGLTGGIERSFHNVNCLYQGPRLIAAFRALKKIRH